MKRALAMCGFTLSVIMGGSTAAAHQAPSGWQYPPHCCKGDECGAIASHRVQIVKGGYLLDERWFITGDKSQPTNLLLSPDDHFHACWSPIASERERGPRCFFAPQLTN